MGYYPDFYNLKGYKYFFDSSKSRCILYINTNKSKENTEKFDLIHFMNINPKQIKNMSV